MTTIGLHERPTVLVLLPRAGLGHSLLVWARAAVFAHINRLRLQTVGWNQVRIGPWLRQERTKRFYGTYFNPDADIWDRLSVRPLYHATPDRYKLVNPPVEPLPERELERLRWIAFSDVSHWSDYFRDLKPYRSFVCETLFGRVRPHLHRALASCARPSIGVHARMGDFRPLAPGEDFAKVGAVRTPQSYFVDVIKTVRAQMGTVAPVTIFSDGRHHELADILSLPATELAPPRPDIVDMLLLSRSEVIVASAGSSFSYWAGFLSDAPIVLHPDHIHASIRPESSRLYEGPVAGFSRSHVQATKVVQSPAN